jgi:hypothetical protein
MSQYGGAGGGGEKTREQVRASDKALVRKYGSFSAIPLLYRYGSRWGNEGGGGGDGGSPTDPTNPPTTPPTDQKSLYWQFPEYTQSWAFTPPEPTPYMYPEPFDTKKFGNPLNKKDVKKNR